jgi:hypothetical protein
MSGIDEPAPRSHYHFRISLRVRHPSVAPEKITEAVRIEPKHSWKAGEPRQTPTGTPLTGDNRDTYWTAEITAGRWPLGVNEAIHDTLKSLVTDLSCTISAPKVGRWSFLLAGFSRIKAATC